MGAGRTGSDDDGAENVGPERVKRHKGCPDLQFSRPVTLIHFSVEPERTARAQAIALSRYMAPLPDINNPKKQHIINSMCCFMRLFGFNPIKEAGGWEVLTSEEEIAEMERQGCDMSSVRKKRASKHAPIAAKEQTILPGNRLPEDGIIPFLLETPPQIQIIPKHKYPFNFPPFPGKYYQA